MRRNLSRPWTESDFGDLQKMLFEGRSLAAIASRLRRSRSAVATKISHLGWSGLRRQRPSRNSHASQRLN
jgi:hypothetical protein